MNRRFADTFYFLALLNADDDAHDRALELSRHTAGSYVTTAWVLTELADAMAKPRARAIAADFIQRLLRNRRFEIVPFSQELFDRGLALFQARLDKEWSLTDCISSPQK